MIEHRILYESNIVRGKLIVTFKDGSKSTFNLSDIESVATEKII